MVQGVSSWGKRTMVVAIAAVLATCWAMFGGGVGAVLAAGESTALLEATNTSRQQLAGSNPLARAADLDAIAQRHAEAMAARGGLFHNPELASQVSDWRIVAENVGVGYDIAAIHQAFLDSPSHRGNVLDARLTQLGIGIVAGGDSRLWVVEVFRTPAAATATAAAAAPAPTADTAVVAASAAAPRRQPVAAAAPTTATNREAEAARHAAATTDAEAGARRAAAQAQAAAAAQQAAEAKAAAEAQAAEAARVAAEIAAVASTVDLTQQAPYTPAPVALDGPQLVASDVAAATTGRPAVALAGALWLLVALSLLRRVRSDVVHTTRAVRRLVVRMASA